jgi:hypothetical protein
MSSGPTLELLVDHDQRAQSYSNIKIQAIGAASRRCLHTRFEETAHLAATKGESCLKDQRFRTWQRRLLSSWHVLLVSKLPDRPRRAGRERVRDTQDQAEESCTTLYVLCYYRPRKLFFGQTQAGTLELSRKAG